MHTANLFSLANRLMHTFALSFLRPDQIITKHSFVSIIGLP